VARRAWALRPAGGAAAAATAAAGGAALTVAHRPAQAKHGPDAATSVRDSRLQGSFIYTGSGKKQSKTASRAQQLCAKKARDMQWCLAKNNHKEKWCKAVIDVWRKCQEEVKAAEDKEEAEREAKAGHQAAAGGGGGGGSGSSSSSSSSSSASGSQSGQEARLYQK
jgi:hypothetical protein